MASSAPQGQESGPSAHSLRSFAQGIRHVEWPAMSEPGGSPEADRQVSRMVEAVGVEPTSERPVAAELYMLIRP